MMAPTYWWLYNGLLLVGSLLCFPFMVVALITTPKLRAGLVQKLGLQPLNVPVKAQRRVWVHCVSVGELNAATPLIKVLQETWDVVISTTTATGYGLAQSRYANVFFYPLDYPWAVMRAFQTVQPDRLIILETELWPNLFYIAASYCPDGLWLVNARLSDGSFKNYRKIRPFMTWMLHLPQGILAQTPADADRFEQLGARAVYAMGNLKFDVAVEPSSVRVNQFKQRLNPDCRVVVFASTHEGEEAAFLNTVYLLQKRPDVQVVIAPRHPERGAAIQSWLATRHIQSMRQAQSPNEPIRPEKVWILDTIGQLTALYAVSHLVIIGGSFIPHGGQNPLEPLALNVPVITGPYMGNFKQMMADLGPSITQVPDATQLEIVINAWLDMPTMFQPLLHEAATRLEAAKGATQVALRLMEKSSNTKK
jgi:3-deoxy-D-manno-octulosonic-acid transferase